MRLEAADDQIFLPGKIHIQRVSEEGWEGKRDAQVS